VTRIPINLATEPFRKDRAATVVAVSISAVLVVLLGVQAFLILSSRASAAENRDAVTMLQAQLDAASVEEAQAQAVLREPMNAEVLQQSVLLNALVQRKSISWSRLFADIEGVLPPNVRLVQVRLPQINSRNEVTLDMEVGARDSSDAIAFTKRLQESPLFGPATLLRSDPPTQNEPLYRYRLTVSYGQKF
jgi:Tfp pilus assembly protein PilN